MVHHKYGNWRFCIKQCCVSSTYAYASYACSLRWGYHTRGTNLTRCFVSSFF
jgi:hypothetical protein